MLSKVLFVCILLFCCVTTQGKYVSKVSPFEQGELNSSYIYIAKDSRSTGPPQPLDIYLPSNINSSTESFGVIFFLTGLDGDIPVSAYSDFIKRVVSHGFVVIGVQMESYPNIDIAYKFYSSIIWCQAKLQMKNVDYSSYILSGHSAGNKIVVLLMEQHYKGLNVAANVLLNPVDGSNPYHIGHQTYCIHPPAKVDYVSPTFILGTGYGDVSSFSPFIPACAPKGMNFPRFQHGMNLKSPLATWNATEWGHVSFLNSWVSDAGVCHKPGIKNPPYALYQAFVAGLLIGPGQIYLQGNPSVENTLFSYKNSALGAIDFWNRFNVTSNPK